MNGRAIPLAWGRPGRTTGRDTLQSRPQPELRGPRGLDHQTFKQALPGQRRRTGPTYLAEDMRHLPDAHRPLATRYDKLAVRYEATVRSAAINEWLLPAFSNWPLHFGGPPPECSSAGLSAELYFRAACLAIVSERRSTHHPRPRAKGYWVILGGMMMIFAVARPRDGCPPQLSALVGGRS
jgi:hypothetical protein